MHWWGLGAGAARQHCTHSQSGVETRSDRPAAKTVKADVSVALSLYALRRAFCCGGGATRPSSFPRLGQCSERVHDLDSVEHASVL